MTKAKWLIVDLGSEKDINNLCYSALENGRDAEVVSLKDVAERLETPDKSRQCIVPSGSIWFNKTLKKQCPNYIGGWHNEETFSCHSYYGYYGKYIAQQNYIMMPFGEIERRADWLYSHFKTDEIFIRPDSGEKDFVGCLVSNVAFKTWYDRAILWDDAKKSLMCIVAPPLDIKKELRLLVKDRKVITGSTYRIAKHIIREPLEEQEDQAEIIAFAENLLSTGDHHLNLPPAHTIDVALLDTGYSIMEVHCCCCCGRYAMDMRKFTLAISEAAEKAYDDACKADKLEETQ